MLKRIYKLKTRYNFKKVLRQGKIFHTDNFVIRYLKIDEKVFLNDPAKKKFAIITSNKLTKKKVNQNKIRRIVSHVLRENLEKFPNNYYYVFIPKKSVINSVNKVSLNAEKTSIDINTFLSKMDIA